MRICLDVSAAVHQSAGVARYVYNLATHLLKLDDENEYSFFCNQHGEASSRLPGDSIPCRVVSLSDKPWRLLLLTAHKLGLSADRWLPDLDIFHGPDVLAPPLCKARTVITVHDLSFLRLPQYHTRPNRFYLRAMAPVMAKKADAIIADSESTGRDIVALLGATEDKVRVIYPGVGGSFKPTLDEARIDSVKRKYGIARDYILYLGVIEPRKNILCLLEAYRDLSRTSNIEHQLVIAGRRGWLCEGVFTRVKDLGLEGQVVFPGFIPDEDLPDLYSAANLFVYVSFYEGFGLPPLEAMACGTPVVTSNTSSMPEVIGDAGLMVDPDDTTALSTAICRVLNDDSFRKTLVARGLERAKLYSWEKTAQETLRVYRQVV